MPVPQAIIVASSKQLPFCGLIPMVDFEWDSFIGYASKTPMPSGSHFRDLPTRLRLACPWFQ